MTRRTIALTSLAVFAIAVSGILGDIRGAHVHPADARMASQNANATDGAASSADMSGMSNGITPQTTPPSNPESLVLSPSQIAAQNQDSLDLLHEKALVPKILPDGSKQFVLTPSEFAWNLWNGESVDAWGYNGQVAGPLIRVKVGDKVQIVVHNRLPDATTVHWHGLAVPNSMDGVPYVTQNPIQPNETFIYKFTVTPQMVGTHYYHSHYNDLFQVNHGLYGPFIVDPATPTGPHYDVDALYILSSWTGVTPGNAPDVEDTFSMDGKPYPNAPQLNVKRGQRVLIRLINASGVSEHAMHLHGYSFKVVAIDGNPVANPQLQNTITMLPGETADISFIANNPGKWMFHCHILDHMINPGDDADMMGGLVTFINVK